MNQTLRRRIISSFDVPGIQVSINSLSFSRSYSALNLPSPRRAHHGDTNDEDCFRREPDSADVLNFVRRLSNMKDRLILNRFDRLYGVLLAQCYSYLLNQVFKRDTALLRVLVLTVW